MPNPSCTDGKQKTSAPTYSAARRSRETSPRRITDSPRPSSSCRRTRRGYSGPCPTMRICTSGIPVRSTAAACRRSWRRLRGYMRATESTTGRAVWGPRRARELGVPGLEVDGLGHHGEAIGGHAVRPPGHLRAIATRHHDEVGAAGIEALPARLQREERAHPAALVPELVGDDALEARHERHPPAPGPEKAVEIHPHHEVDVARGRQANAGIVEPSVEGVKAGAAPQRPHGHLVTQGREAAVQPRDPHERSAALPRVQRRGREDRDAQGRPGPDRGYRPRNRGDRFSRNARVPSL